MFKYRYRTFIQTQLKFQNVLRLEDPEILHKITLSYRLGFFKDTVIARWVEDDTQLFLTNVYFLPPVILLQKLSLANCD